MTNNKHKEIMERFEEKRFLNRFMAWAISLSKLENEFGSLMPQTPEQINRFYDFEKELKDFLSSALTEQLEEIEGWVKRQNGHKRTDYFTEEQVYSYNQAIIDTLSHIREKKEEINNNK